MGMMKKEALLRAAKELVGECGYTETTFKKISERAGVALGLLTHHYGNKEKLFLAAGMDVLERFHEVLQRACDEGKNGRESVLNFCKAYLDFSIDPDSNFEKFNDIHKLLEQQLWRGIEDGSIRELLVKETAQILMSLVVGANRTRVLTPYAPPHLYREAVAFAARAITPCNACE